MKLIAKFNCHDGERCVEADEIAEHIQKKENSDSFNDYQSSHLEVNG